MFTFFTQCSISYEYQPIYNNDNQSFFKWGFDPENYWYSCFDIKYRDQSTTYNNQGWRVTFQVDNDPSKILLASKYRGTATHSKIHVNTSVEIPFIKSKNYILITWTATNKDTVAHTISLSAYADVQIGNNDKADITWYGAATLKQGLIMKDRERVLALLVRNGYRVTDVDHFWFGKYEYQNYHEFDDNNDINGINDIDSAFSFGWKNRPIYPNQSINLSVLLGIGEKLSERPSIKQNTPFKTTYSVNEPIRVHVQYVDTDKSHHYVYLKYKFLDNEERDLESYNPSDNSFGTSRWRTYDSSSVLKCPGTSGSYPIEIWAEDEFGMKSVIIKSNIMVEFHNEAPRLTLTERIGNRYAAGGSFLIAGTVWDDGISDIWFKIDDFFQFKIHEKIECNKAVKEFRNQFDLSQVRMIYGKHTIKIWAQDTYGLKSSEEIAEFHYVRYSAPTIEVVSPTDVKNKYFNQGLEIQLKVGNINVGEKITVYAKLPEKSETDPMQPIYTFQATSDQEIFNYTYIVKTVENTTHEVKFVAVDPQQVRSSECGVKFNKINYEESKVTTPLPTGSNYTETEAEDSNGKKTIIFIGVNSVTKSESESTALFENGKAGINKEKLSQKQKTIFGVAGALIALALIAGAAIILYEASKKPAEFEQEDVGFSNLNEGPAVENDNPIYNADVQDPFANDFEPDNEESIMLQD